MSGVPGSMVRLLSGDKVLQSFLVSRWYGVGAAKSCREKQVRGARRTGQPPNGGGLAVHVPKTGGVNQSAVSRTSPGSCDASRFWRRDEAGETGGVDRSSERTENRFLASDGFVQERAELLFPLGKKRIPGLQT